MAQPGERTAGRWAFHHGGTRFRVGDERMIEILTNSTCLVMKKFYLAAFAVFLAVGAAAAIQGYCRKCGGSGVIQEHCAYCKGYGESYCSTCGGTGKRYCGYCGGSGQKQCGYCRGRGLVNNDTEYCPKCGGYRVVACTNCNGSGQVNCPASDCRNGIVPCRHCNRTGIHEWKCPRCHGSGREPR